MPSINDLSGHERDAYRKAIINSTEYQEYLSFVVSEYSSMRNMPAIVCVLAMLGWTNLETALFLEKEEHAIESMRHRFRGLYKLKKGTNI